MGGVPSSQTLALIFYYVRCQLKQFSLGIYVLGNDQKGKYYGEFGPMFHLGLELSNIAPLKSLYNVKTRKEFFLL